MRKFYLTSLVLSGLAITCSLQAQTIDITYAQADTTNSCVNDTISFNAQADLTGYAPGDSVTFHINFGDGTLITKKSKILGTGSLETAGTGNVPYAYTMAGTYPIETIVVAPDGKRDTNVTTTPLVINNCSTLEGRVYIDNNADCSYNAGDSVLSSIYLFVGDGASPPNYYFNNIRTDNNGMYSVLVPVGTTYNIHLISIYTSVCIPGGYTGVTAGSTGLDFAIAPTVSITNTQDSVNGVCPPNTITTHTINAKLTGYTPGDSATAIVDFGDGTVLTSKTVITGSPYQYVSFLLTHSYLISGSYYIETIVVGPNGTADTNVATTPVVITACSNLSGTVYVDENNDCTLNPGEMGIPGAEVAVRTLSPLKDYYLTTDANGEYSITLPSGTNYDVYLNHGPLGANSCPTGWYSAISPAPGIDFGIRKTIEILHAEPDSATLFSCLNNPPSTLKVLAQLIGYQTGDTLTSLINWGDGSPVSTVKTVMPVTGAFLANLQVNHTYVTPGTYYVQTIAIAPNGLRDTSVSALPFTVAVCGNLSGKVYMDNNSDCIFNASDDEMTNRIVRVTGSSTSTKYYAVTDVNGNYSIDLPNSETYTVESQNYYLLTACPPGGHTAVSVPSSNVDIGMQCTNAFDLHALLFGTNFRPGFTRIFATQAYNWTCTPVSGSIKVILSDPRISYASTSPSTPTPIISGDTVIWNFSNLDYTNNATPVQPFTFNILTSTSAAIGESICIDVIVTPESGDANPLNNVKTFCYRVLNSYDPNEKVGTLGVGTENIIAPETRIDYTVHFQNTGNDVAYNVHILDTLDDNLDLSTLYIEGSTHDMTYDILEGNVLRFNFNGINLPDSNTNLAMSQGAVSYSIDHKSGISLGTMIENTAHIYFDFNAAIVTNTTVHTIDEIEIVDGIGENQQAARFARLYPNPTKDLLTIDLTNDLRAQLSIRTLVGQTVGTQSLNQGINTVDFSEMPSGIYLIEINAGGMIQLEKIIVQHN